MMDAELSAIQEEAVYIVSRITHMTPCVEVYRAYQGGFIVAFCITDLVTRAMLVPCENSVYDAAIMVACEWLMSHPPVP